LTCQVIVYTVTSKEIEFDPAKDRLNIRNHGGLSLSLAAEMSWEAALMESDDRFPYDEIRMHAIVPLGNRLYHVTFTERGGKMRVISLRYAKKKELADYVQRYR
jgi:uncharacterized DUF497 family protein